LNFTATWIFIMAFFIAELFFYTWCRIQCVNIGYEMSDQEKIYRSRAALRNNLEIELSRLKSPDRIEKIAKERLGLKMPGPKQVVIIP